MGTTLSYPTVDLTSKVVIVTGGNAGIGYETTKALAVMGAHTIIACRSEERAQTAIEQMRQEVSQSHPDKTINVEFMKLDLSSFKSTKDFAVAFKDKNLPLDILINNAGILGPPLTMTEDGNESQFQVNHLSHFLLTLELLPVLLSTTSRTGDGRTGDGRTGDGRIVILSSNTHESGVFDPTNLNAEKSFGRLNFYQNSKLFNVMHGYALQRRLKESRVTVSSLHPGFVNTEIFEKGASDSGGRHALWKVTKFFAKPIIMNVQQGSATSINCAVNPELNKQEHFYYTDCNVKAPIPASQNQELQEQLWEISIDKVKDWLSPESLENYGQRMGTSQPLEEQQEEQGGSDGNGQSHDNPPTGEVVTTETQNVTTPISETPNEPVQEALEDTMTSNDDTTAIVEPAATNKVNEETPVVAPLSDEVDKQITDTKDDTTPTSTDDSHNATPISTAVSSKENENEQ